MVLFNYSTKELTAKVVYYGPALCGKTSNLQWIHEKLPIKNKGKMLSLATETDRTLFFDFLPIEIGTIRGMRTRIQLYTVPGQVFYNATRRMVLKGADAVVFVCDSQEPLLDANVESYENMRQNLEANEIVADEIPIVMQYNKRDLPNALPIEILNERLNLRDLPFFEAVAPKGIGVEDTLKAVTKLVFRSLSVRYGDPSASSPGQSRPPMRPQSAPEVMTAAPVGAPGGPPDDLGFTARPAPAARAATPAPPPEQPPANAPPLGPDSGPPRARPPRAGGARPPTEMTLPTPSLHAALTPEPRSSLHAHPAHATLVSTANEAEELRRRIAAPHTPAMEDGAPAMEDLDLEEIEEVDTSPFAPPPVEPPLRPATIPPPQPVTTPEPPSQVPQVAGPSEIEVPVEIPVAPGTTEIRLRLRLILKPKRS